MKDMINDWKPELLSLLETLVRHGLKPFAANNGEDAIKTDNLTQLAECLEATDEGTLRVTTPAGARCTLFIVLGNEPGVIVSDYTVDPLLDAATEEHYDTWNGRSQPKKPNPYVTR